MVSVASFKWKKSWLSGGRKTLDVLPPKTVSNSDELLVKQNKRLLSYETQKI